MTHSWVRTTAIPKIGFLKTEQKTKGGLFCDNEMIYQSVHVFWDSRSKQLSIWRVCMWKTLKFELSGHIKPCAQTHTWTEFLQRKHTKGTEAKPNQWMWWRKIIICPDKKQHWIRERFLSFLRVGLHSYTSEMLPKRGVKGWRDCVIIVLRLLCVA